MRRLCRCHCPRRSCSSYWCILWRMLHCCTRCTAGHRILLNGRKLFKFLLQFSTRPISSRLVSGFAFKPHPSASRAWAWISHASLVYFHYLTVFHHFPPLAALTLSLSLSLSLSLRISLHFPHARRVHPVMSSVGSNPALFWQIT